MNRKKGFTLAELLITLTIVGIVAGLTIPATSNIIRDSYNIALFKEDCSILTQATKTLALQIETIRTDNCWFMRDDYATVLKYTNKVDDGKLIFAPFYTFYKNSNNQGNLPDVNYGALQLINGSTIHFRHSSGNCDAVSGSLNTVCATIHIDVNGKNGPNMHGKDLFYVFVIKRNGAYEVVPYGANSDGSSCVVNSGSEATSSGCAAYALRDILP